MFSLLPWNYKFLLFWILPGHLGLSRVHTAQQQSSLFTILPSFPFPSFLFPLPPSYLFAFLPSLPFIQLTTLKACSFFFHEWPCLGLFPWAFLNPHLPSPQSQTSLPSWALTLFIYRMRTQDKPRSAAH